MVKDIKSYVNSDATVKAARKKLSAANEKLQNAKDALAKSRGASGDVVTDIQRTITAAENEHTAALQAATEAENAATAYYKKNYKSLTVGEGKKSLAGLEAALAQAKDPATAAKLKADIAKIKETVANPQDYVEPPKAGKDGQGIKGSTEGTGSNNDALIDQTNKALASLAEAKTAANFIHGLSDAERLNWVKKLDPTGKNLPQTGKYNRYLVDAYVSALSEAQAENTFNKGVAGFIPHTLDSYLTYKAGLTKGGAGGPNIDIVNVSDVDAASYIEQAFNKELSRKATNAEIKALIPAIKDYVKSNARRSSTSGNITTSTSSPNPVDWLTQVIRGQQQIGGFNLKDKNQAKAAAKVSGIVSNLQKEYGSKEENKYNSDIQKLQETARLNSYPLNEEKIKQYKDRLAAGEDLATLQKGIRDLVGKTYFSDNKNVQDLLNAGQNLDDIYSPYRTTMSQILEVPYDKIDLQDPTLTQAIGPGANMPLYQYKQALRKDPRWQYTNNARETVNTGLAKVLRDFGFMG